MLFLLLLLTFACSAGLTAALLRPSDAQLAVWRRLEAVRRVPGADRRAAEDAELGRPFAERVLQPAWRGLQARLLRLTPSGVAERMEQRLHQAGRPIELAQYVALKAVFVGCGFLLGLLAAGGGSGPLLDRLALPAALAALGAYLPDFWLSAQRGRRQRALAAALPDVLDLLSVSVEAGLGFDGAVAKVSEKFGDPVGSEFQRYLREVRLGKTREEALRALAERGSLPELRTFVAAVIQADQLGASLTRVLRLQSDSLRTKRKQAAEERAMKAPIKMLIPLVVFIFPTLFVVILGPAALRVLEAFGR